MQLRPAEPADAMAVARVHVRSWQAGYRSLLPAAFLDALRPEDRARRYDFATTDPLKPRTILAVEAGVILGFVAISPSRDADLSAHGEICALYVDPPHWSRGIGLALVSAARARLVESGYGEALLWALVGNARADRFYRMDGWEPDGARRTLSREDVTPDEIRYRRLF